MPLHPGVARKFSCAALTDLSRWKGNSLSLCKSNNAVNPISIKPTVGSTPQAEQTPMRSSQARAGQSWGTARVAVVIDGIQIGPTGFIGPQLKRSDSAAKSSSAGGKTVSVRTLAEKRRERDKGREISADLTTAPDDTDFLLIYVPTSELCCTYIMTVISGGMLRIVLC